MLRPSDLAQRADFRLGPLSVSPARRLIEGPSGKIHVEPLVMRVFLMLLDADGSVVTRETLFDECWGGVVIGDDSLNRSISMVRRIASSTSPGIFEIEAIPRTGYRLVGELLSFRPEEAVAPAKLAEPEATARQSRRRVITLGALGALVAAIIGALLYFAILREPAQAEPASIAVLPFRNLSGGTPYFAEGVGEEISVQLSREPQFRVMGRMSARQFGNGTAPEVGRKLNVDYVLEGSVRAQAQRVRVTTALIRTSDGVQLWSDSYDGRLDDIFAIQQQIGSSVAGALKRRLVRYATASASSSATSGEAHNLYLTARGMLRARDPQLASGATGLLRHAIRLDPNFAPAWSSLAQALRYRAGRDGQPGPGHEAVIDLMPDAVRFARHSIRLDPERPEGYAVLGMLLGFASPEARSGLDRAVELDPNNAEALVWLAASNRASGEFDAAMANYHRALELDPHWIRAIRDLAVSTAEMGNRPAAESLVARAQLTSQQRDNLYGRIAWAVGDFSEAIRRWSLASNARPGSEGLTKLAGQFLQDALFEVGLPGKPLPADWPPNYDGRLENRRVRFTTPPEAEVWRLRNRSELAARVYQKENRVGAKLLLNAGRARELVATYDSPAGLLGFRPGQRLRGDLLRDAPTVMLVLRGAGRNGEAERLAREADALIRAIYRRGPVPFSFDAEAAAIRAVQGRHDEALSSLEGAVRRGWTHIGDSDLKDIADEPAFAPLRDNPRFGRIRAGIRAHYQRERQEIARLRL